MGLPPLGDILLKAQLLSPRQLRVSWSAAEENQLPWVKEIVRSGACAEGPIAQALHESTRLARAPAEAPANPELLTRVPRTVAERYGVYPLALREGGRELLVAMVDPTDPAALEALATASRALVRPMVALLSQWERAMHAYRPPAPAASPAPSPETAEVRLRRLVERQKQVSAAMRAVSELLAEKGLQRP
ncbi:MAG TPA: hypothetical protein VEY30_12150 [Myxococcaceae bacterium]|nr:hypothetical protein [Myxococcaceae bacterium]